MDVIKIWHFDPNTTSIQQQKNQKTKKPKRKHDYITANFHNWFLLFLSYCKVNVEEVRKCSSRQKPEDTTQLWEGFFSLSGGAEEEEEEEEKQLLNGHVFFYCVCFSSRLTSSILLL